jgi:hypothetical protein
VTSRNGSIIDAPDGQSTGAATATDANGNQITVNGSGQFFDTLSGTTPVLTVAGNGHSCNPGNFLPDRSAGVEWPLFKPSESRTAGELFIHSSLRSLRLGISKNADQFSGHFYPLPEVLLVCEGKT